MARPPGAGVYDFDMSDLSLHRTLYRAALASSHIFAWVLLFDALRVFGSLYAALALVTLLYAISHTLSLFFTPLAGMSLGHSVKRTLSLAVLSYTLALTTLILAFSGIFGSTKASALIGCIGFVIFYALHRALYFAPFSVEASLVENRTTTLTEVVLAVLPVATGVLLMLPSGYVYALGLSAVIALLSLLPVRTLPERYERFEWSYGDAFFALFVRGHRRLVLGSLADGMQAAGLLFFWPLALFFIVSGSYLSLGFVLALTLLLTMLLRHLLHPYLSTKIVWSPDTRATVMLSSWLMRFSAFSPLSAAIADTVYYTGSTHRVYALDPLTLEQTADGGSYIDELTTLKEMAYAIGKIMLALIAVGAALTESLYVFFGTAFLLAILGSLISVYLVRSERKLA